MTNRLVDYFVITSIDNAFTPVTTSHLKTVEDVTLEKVRFKTNMMDRFPFKDYPDAPLSHEIGLFCLPGGVTITEQCELPTFFVFVLTGGDGARTYGACLNFYEGLDNEEELHKLHNVLENLRIEIGTRNSLMTSNDATDSELENDDEEDAGVLGEGENEMLSAKQKKRRGSTTPDTTQLIEALSSQTRKQNKPLYISKSFCLISHWPFFQSFKTFLTELYRISITPSKVPIERIISNFLLEVPLPPQGCAQVQYSIGEKTIVLSRPPPNDLPLSEVNYELLFKVLSVDNILFLFNCILNERQILFYSTHPSLLGTVAEALSSFIFPLHWHHVYIPVLPRSCIEFISAPVPFIMGCDSSFLHGVSIPVDVIKVNLDNNMVGAASTRLPKLPERQYNRLREEILKLVRDRGAIRDPTESSYFDLQFIDVAFNLAPIPEEITQYGLMANVLPRPGVGLKPVPFNAHEVRMTFFRFFVSYLQKYKSFIINDKDSEAALQEAKQNVFLFEANAHFKKDMFIRDLPENAKAFSRVFLETQAFQRFLMDRLLNEDIASIKMFTESVQNKLNRFSKLESMLTKKETTFLNDRSSQVTKTVVAISPDVTNLPTGVFVYPYFPKLNHTLINPPREIKHLVTVNDVLAQQTSITSVMPNRYNKDIMDSWKTILTTLVALSNQVGKRRSTALMGKFRKAPEIVIDSEKPTPTIQGRPTHKRGHTRTLSVPISSGSIGDIGEIDFTDIETDLSQLSNSSGNQINFGGASLFVENKQNSAPISRSVGALSLVSPSSPISTASSGSYDPSNMPPQPEFDDGIMNQRTDSEQQQVRAKEIESSSLFSRFTFNTRDKCPSCNFELTDQDIRSGWTHSTQEYRTSCPQCQTKFVPRFTVIIDKIGEQNKPPLQRVSSLTNPIDCETVEENDDGSNLSNNTPPTSPTIVANGMQNSPPQRKFDSPVKRVQQSAGNRLTENIKNFMSAIKRTDSNLGDSESSVGSHHNTSASSDNLSINYDDHHTYHKLKYEYLSPIVLKKEVENLLSKEVTADAKLFKEHPLIFWNLICHFRGLLIPLNFLLPQVDWLTVMDELTSMIEQTKTASSNSETTSMSLDLDSDALMLETLERMNNELLSMQSKSRQSSPPTLLASK